LNKTIFSGYIKSNREIAEGHYLLTVQLPFEFATPQPGQFVMLRIKGRGEPFLGRPLSVYDFHRHSERVICEILYKVIGKGTQLLSKMRVRDVVEVLGPLGHPFTLASPKKNIVLIAGGMGIAPMTFLAAHYRSSKIGSRTKIICYAGARDIESLAGIERMQVLSELKICTDNGSRGYHGFVTELFKKDIPSYDARKTVAYACGPRPMLKQMATILQKKPIPCEVSLEERMACGVGVCLGCVTAVKDGKGKRKYERVCTEGPVFNINDVIWDR
jgi:dihydroorotate dehydrogenase electron transfer subunit